MRPFILFIMLIPNLGTIIAQKSAEDYYRLGMIKDDLSAVIANFSKAIELKPDFKAAYYNRALAYMNLKSFNEALSDVNKLLQLDSTKAEYFNLKGKMLLNLKDGYLGAYTCFSKAIALNPKFAEAYYERGILKNRLENNLPARNGCSDLKKARELGFKVPANDFINCDK